MEKVPFNPKFPGRPEKTESEKPSVAVAIETEDESPTFTRAELGKGLIQAIRSGDGEAVFEAWKKMSEGTPSDE